MNQLTTCVPIDRMAADEAMRLRLAQIHEKQYAAGYRDASRPVTLVGAAFDKAQRNLGHWLIESA